MILYIWLPEDQNQSVRAVANAQTPFYQQFHILKVLRSYKSVLKDRNYMLMISGFSILMMGEFSTSSYIAIRLKDQFETISIGPYDITGQRC